VECSEAHLNINRFKASCVSREQDLQSNSWVTVCGEY
jgi:hypothetical protein